eukprot:s831_g5.t1
MARLLGVLGVWVEELGFLCYVWDWCVVCWWSRSRGTLGGGAEIWQHGAEFARIAREVAGSFAAFLSVNGRHCVCLVLSTLQKREMVSWDVWSFWVRVIRGHLAGDAKSMGACHLPTNLASEQALAELAELHAQGIRQDLKLENVMFDRTPPANSKAEATLSCNQSPVKVKLIDFDTIETVQPPRRRSRINPVRKRLFTAKFPYRDL